MRALYIESRLTLITCALALGLGVGCASDPADEPAPTSEFEQPTDNGGKGDVFGTDDRGDIYSYDETSPLRIASDGVAGMVLTRKLTFDTDAVSLTEAPRTLGEYHDLCEDQRFVNQPKIANCSGFLVAPDILVTAGHCINERDGIGCGDVSWVFGLEYQDETSAEEGAVPTFGPDDVYGCAQVLAHQDIECSADYAVIRLDREVVGRSPLNVEAARPAIDDEVYAIGFPSGIPKKIAPGKVDDMSYYTSADSFEAKIDGFGGNSGGPVVDAEGNVRGILVCGNALPEYVPAGGGCWRTSECAEDGVCRGIGVYAIDNLTPYLDCKTADPSADCIDERTTYPSCDGYGQDTCPDGLSCQLSERVTAFHCLAETENMTAVGENCYLEACPAGTVCQKTAGRTSGWADYECRTICKVDADCPRGERCGPRFVDRDYQVCYPQ